MIELNIFLTEFPEEDEDIDEYITEETMTEESGEEENDTRKVKVMKRKAKGALKSKGKVRSSTDFNNGLFMLQLLCRHFGLAIPSFHNYRLLGGGGWLLILVECILVY